VKCLNFPTGYLSSIGQDKMVGKGAPDMQVIPITHFQLIASFRLKSNCMLELDLNSCTIQVFKYT